MSMVESRPLPRSRYSLSLDPSGESLSLCSPPTPTEPPIHMGGSAAACCASAGAAKSEATRVARVRFMAASLADQELATVARGIRAVDRVVAVDAAAGDEARVGGAVLLPVRQDPRLS